MAVVKADDGKRLTPSAPYKCRHPANAEEFRKVLPLFQRWAEVRGSVFEKPTNPYELARFTTPEGLGIVYQNGKGRISSWQCGANEAWLEWLNPDSAWRVTPHVNKVTGEKRRVRVDVLLHRDGNTYAYCGWPMADDDVTLEHWISLTHGGSNETSNLMLAHKYCNNLASHMNIREKLELAVKIRAGKEVE